MFRSTVRNYQVWFTSQTIFTKIKPRMSSITQTKTDKIKSMITFQEQASDEHEVNPADMLAVSYNNEWSSKRWVLNATITHKCHNFLYIIISMFQVILMWGESDIQFINGALIWMVPSDLKHLWLLITLWRSSTCLVLFSKYCHGQFTARKISCQSLVFRGDSSFQPCDSYPPPSTGCQSRVGPS